VGRLDTVIEGQTGVFFGEQTVEALCDALIRLDEGPARRKRAGRTRCVLTVRVFERELASFIEERYDEMRRGTGRHADRRHELD
jgi:hypothetical protein